MIIIVQLYYRGILTKDVGGARYDSHKISCNIQTLDIFNGFCWYSHVMWPRVNASEDCSNLHWHGSVTPRWPESNKVRDCSLLFLFNPYCVAENTNWLTRIYLMQYLKTPNSSRIRRCTNHSLKWKGSWTGLWRGRKLKYKTPFQEHPL